MLHSLSEFQAVLTLEKVQNFAVLLQFDNKFAKINTAKIYTFKIIYLIFVKKYIYILTDVSATIFFTSVKRPILSKFSFAGSGECLFLLGPFVTFSSRSRFPKDLSNYNATYIYIYI